MSTFSAIELVAVGAVVLAAAGTVVVAAGSVVDAGAAVSSSDEQAVPMTVSRGPPRWWSTRGGGQGEAETLEQSRR